MKIVLIKPWWDIPDYYGPEEGASPPLGIASIAGVLEKYGHSVSIFDFLGTGIRKKGCIRSALKKESPDIVGISISTFNRFHGLEIANIAKELGCIVVVGGPHVTFDFENTLRNVTAVDYVILGEGEETMQELAEAIDKKKPVDTIRGIAYRRNGEIIVNASHSLIDDLDKLPRPAYHLLPMDQYSYHLIVGSRGCAYQCIFCVSPRFWKGKVRFKSYNLVVDEIEYLIKNFGNKYFSFRDDMIILNKQWCVNFFQEIIKRNIRINWSIMARVDMRDEEIFKLMKEAGCDTIRFGVESGSERVMKAIRKNITKEDVREAVRLAKKFGLNVGTYFMIGHPTETVQDMEESYKFCCELDAPHYVFGPTSIYPGTYIHELAEKEGVLSRGFNWFDRKNMVRFKRGFNTLEGVPTYCTGDFSRKFLEETAKRFCVRRLLSSFAKTSPSEGPIPSRRKMGFGRKIKIRDIRIIFTELMGELRARGPFKEKARFLLSIFLAYF